MGRKSIDLVLSVIAALLAIALSWPFFRDFHYWPVFRHAWHVYVLLGFVLSVYVFYVFVGALRTLFAHDAQLREQASDEASRKPEDRS